MRTLLGERSWLGSSVSGLFSWLIRKLFIGCSSCRLLYGFSLVSEVIIVRRRWIDLDLFRHMALECAIWI